MRVVNEACFFFSSRRRHTRFKCDWSSDVCSSDLWLLGRSGGFLVFGHRWDGCSNRTTIRWHAFDDSDCSTSAAGAVGIDRKSVVEGKSVDLGGRRIIKKKKKLISSGRQDRVKRKC